MKTDRYLKGLAAKAAAAEGITIGEWIERAIIDRIRDSRAISSEECARLPVWKAA